VRAPRDKFRRYDEINLRGLADRAFAISGIEYGTSLIMLGGFEEADVVLEEAARYLPDNDPERRVVERLLAVTAERLGKREKAVAHIRTCIALSKSDAWTVQELLATITLIELTAEDLEAGRKALAEAPADSRHPDVVAARCTLVTKEALRDMTRLDEAIGHVREAMRSHPPDDTYRLVRLYKDLVLTKVGAREAQTPEGKALLEEAIGICKHEIDLRPECPPLYFAVYRMYKLLGNAEQEIRYQELHERKKKEWEHKEKYDQRGRPRCGQ
jgi:tetratricopeptide (TPR) repeat protein